MTAVTIDMLSSQQQNSSDSMQNNNGDNRSLASTGVRAQENVPITKLLEMGASRLGVLACGWMVLMLVQGGIFVTVETKDRVFVTVLFFLVCFRCWCYYYPQYIRSSTEASQSLSAVAIPIGFISRLFYRWNFVSVMTCVVLSMMRLASQDFGQKELANKGAQDFVLNVFYGLAFAEALVLLIARTFVKIMAVQRKVRKALIEWLKPSQPAQAIEWLKLRSEHDVFLTINWRNLKYSHPSLECGLRSRVSRPPQLLLKEDYSDDSEDNLPHLKAA